MLKAFEISKDDELVFLGAKFNEMRFGFRASDVRSRLSQDQAILIL